MTDSRTYSELEGTFEAPKDTKVKCPKCAGPCTVKIWSSDCGGYEDEKFTCTCCGHYWWVEGPDA